MNECHVRYNMESKNNPLNYPQCNIYGPEEQSYSKILKKEKKKFPDMAYGNNCNAPEYFSISGLKDHKFSEEEKRIRRNQGKKIIGTKSSLEGEQPQKIRGKRVLPNLIQDSLKITKDEINNNINNANHNKILKYDPRRRDFNIISNTEEKPFPMNSNDPGLFKKMVELSVFIKANDERKFNNKRNKNDGIYDYLVNNKLI